MTVRDVKSDHRKSAMKNWGDPEYRDSYLESYREMSKRYGPIPRTEAFIEKLDEQHGYTAGRKGKSEQKQQGMTDVAAA